MRVKVKVRRAVICFPEQSVGSGVGVGVALLRDGCDGCKLDKMVLFV